MIDTDSFKARYLRDRVPVRLGNLASSLAHLRSGLRGKNANAYASRLLVECQKFVAWTFADVENEKQGTLEQLRIQLEQWRDNWESILENQEQREAVATEAEKWSDVILNLSGILDDEIWDKYHR
jgi:hypothetical protein